MLMAGEQVEEVERSGDGEADRLWRLAGSKRARRGGATTAKADRIRQIRSISTGWRWPLTVSSPAWREPPQVGVCWRVECRRRSTRPASSSGRCSSSWTAWKWLGRRMTARLSRSAGRARWRSRSGSPHRRRRLTDRLRRLWLCGGAAKESGSRNLPVGPLHPVAPRHCRGAKRNRANSRASTYRA